MRKRMLAYLRYIDGILNHNIPVCSAFSVEGNHEISPQKDYIPTRKDCERIIEQHIRQIAFFQHERLIHIIITAVIGLVTFGAFFFVIAAFNFGILAIFIALLVLLVLYVKRYLTYENGIHKMYAQYDQLIRMLI